MHIEKDRKTGNYGNCPKCIHIKYSSYPQVIHKMWIILRKLTNRQKKKKPQNLLDLPVFYEYN